MADVLSICNRALLSVGARTQVSSISPSDGSVEADALSVLFQPTFEALGRTAPFNCLTKQISLTMLMASQNTPENPTGTTFPIPPSPWLYAYAVPADSLLFRFVIPSFPGVGVGNPPETTVSNAAATWVPSSGQIPFALSTATTGIHQTPIPIILTNQDQAQGVYNFNNNNPNNWDSLFQAAMVASLGAFLVPALSLSMPLMQMSIKTAEAAIARARAMDANEGVTSMDHTPDWFLARAGGSNWGLGWNCGGNSFQGWFDVSWPSGGSYGY